MNHTIGRLNQARPETIISLSQQMVLQLASKFFSQKRIVKSLQECPESLSLVGEEDDSESTITTGYQVRLVHLYTRLNQKLFGKNVKRIPKRFLKKNIFIPLSEVVHQQPPL